MNAANLSPRRFLRPHALAALVLLATVPAYAQQIDASVTAPAATPTSVSASPEPIDALAPGSFHWTPEVSPAGPMVIVVSLPQQLAHVYRNGKRIGISTISSGKPGHETPTGVYPILQKREEHYSNLYDGAPMPYMQRLTWDGIALHAGRIPGHPASHGCIRLPKAFAKALFAETERGVTVVVADEASHSMAVVSPGDRAPVDPYNGLEPSQQPIPGQYVLPRQVASTSESAHDGRGTASLE